MSNIILSRCLNKIMTRNDKKMVINNTLYSERFYSSTIMTSEVLLQNNNESEVDWSSAIPFNHIPGPKPIPFLGNTWRFIPFIGDYEIKHLDKVCMNLYTKYGPVVKMSKLIGRPDMLFITEPDDIEKVFRSEDALPYRPTMPSVIYYKHVLRKDEFAGNAGVIGVHGEDWLNFRLKVQQPMLQPRTANLYISSIEDIASDFVKRVRYIKDENSEMPDDFLYEIHKWSLESIANIALDARLGCLDPNPPADTLEMIDAISTLFKCVPILDLKLPFWKLFNTPTWKKYVAALDSIWNISTKNIELAMKIGRVPGRERSLLQRLLDINKNDPKVAVMMALDMFIVGVDTTATSVASTLYQLSIHQKIQEKLYKEILTVLPTKSTLITAAKLEDMRYLKAVIKETMRMYPVILLNGRLLTRDTVIHGYQVPKGTQVIFQNYVTGNCDRYFPDSHTFKPEKWLKQTADMETKEGCGYMKPSTKSPNHHPFAYLPFSYGKRTCIGKRFANLEMQIVICKLVQAYKIEYHHEPLKYSVNPIYLADGPLKFRLLERESI